MKRKYMESMKQKFFRAAVPLVMLAVSAALVLPRRQKQNRE